MLAAVEARNSVIEGEATASADMTNIAVAAEVEVAERVFAQIHIPRTLEELSTKQIERDIATAKQGRGACGQV